MTYEYIQIAFDFGDLEELNKLGSAGFRVIAVITGDFISRYAILERVITGEKSEPAESFLMSTRRYHNLFGDVLASDSMKEKPSK